MNIQPLLRRHPIALALVFLATTALAFQTVRTLAKPGTNDQPLASLTPPGALLSIESPDFAGLLKSWNSSPQQKAWLASANYSVFSNSRLFGRLGDAETQFAAASQIPAATLLPQVAGGQSLFAWYDISNLEFLYITRMPAAQAAQTNLLKSRGKWQQRQAGGLTFYIRTSGNGVDTPKRTVAFASTDGLFLLATREDLIANALELVAASKPGNSLAGEPWFTSASATLKPSGAPPVLHMVLDLERIVPMAQFRTYWVQGNVTEFKQYRSAVADLYSEPHAFHEERAVLLKTPGAAGEPSADADPDLGPLAGFAPTQGVFRATATDVPADAIAAIQEKLLGGVAAAPASLEAPDPSLAPTQAGDTSDLDTRIDTPAPASSAASNQPLAAALQAAGFDALLTYGSAGTGAGQTAAGPDLWVPIHSAVVLHATGTWKPEALAAALQGSLRGSLTTSTLGIEFHPVAAAGSTVYALSGPKPLFFVIEPAGQGGYPKGSFLLLADDQALLASMLAGHPASAPVPASLIAGFNHTAQRAPYARITSLIDGSNKAAADAVPDPAAPPAFFSGNLRSLSDAFAALQSEHLTERHAGSPSGPILRQTVTYEWKQ